jgi:uncharacterized membrane protein HdeD (DUF308 family)
MSAANRESAPCGCSSPGGRLLSRPWLAGVLAALELILGFILLSFPFMLGISAVWVGGFVLAAAGIFRFVQVFVRKTDRWWNLLAAFLYLIVGIFTILMPALSMEWCTLLIGASLLAAGILRMAVAISTWNDDKGKFWRILNAIVSLALGAMIIWGWPESSTWLIGTLIAVEMIFSGWTLMFLALAPKYEN